MSRSTLRPGQVAVTQRAGRSYITGIIDWCRSASTPDKHIPYKCASVEPGTVVLVMSRADSDTEPVEVMTAGGKFFAVYPMSLRVLE